MSAERSLIFGALALQAGLVTPSVLDEALRRWADDPGRSLGEVLVDLGALGPEDRDRLAGSVDRALAASTGTGTISTATATDHGVGVGGPSTVDHTPTGRSTLAATDPWDLTDDGAPVGDDGNGRFRRLRYHDQGGLGQVWVALDAELRREVALKIIRPDRGDRPDVRRRFRTEAIVTGLLEHPGVVPVHGFGVDGQGRPYYAMRFVRGTSFREAIRAFHRADEDPNRDPTERALAFRGLLRRFVDVCLTVGFAHDRGVLHRDLKPDNILLGPFGETLVIDWGLARPFKADDPLGPSPTPLLREVATEPESATPTYVGTPAYMSPEAASGRPEAIATTSDVYGLGALLFALLTGRRPVEDDDVSVVLRKVREGEIPPPGRLNRRVPPALASVCRKAMHLDPSERYQTAAALAVEVERWLADEPVEAHRDPVPVRLARWSRRHRTLVVGLAALLGTALVALAITAALVNAQRRAAEAARDDAEAHLAIGLELIDRLVSLGDSRLADDTTVEQRRELLGTALEFTRRYLDRAPDDRKVRSYVGTLARRLANLERFAGDFDRAEGYYAEAVAQLKSLAEEPGAPDPAAAALLDEARTDWAEARRMNGRPGEAIPLLEEILDDADRRAADGEPDQVRAAGLAGFTLGLALVDVGRLAEAEDRLRAALERWEPIARADLPAIDPEALRRGEMASTQALVSQLVLILIHRGLAEAARLDGRPDDALAALSSAEAAAGAARARLGGLPIDNLTLFDAGIAIQRGQILAADADRRAEARERFEAAVAALRGVIGEGEGNPSQRGKLAEALALRALLQAEGDAPEAALADAEEALALLDGLIDESPRVPDHRSLAGVAEEALGRVALGRGEPEEAHRVLRRAATRHREAIAINPDHPEFRRRAERVDAALATLP